MVSKKSRTEVREKKHSRMRNHLAGTAERPRLAVFRSNNVSKSLCEAAVSAGWPYRQSVLQAYGYNFLCFH